MESHEQQMKDSDMIFTQITTGDFDADSYEQAIVMFYVPDMTISRAGISHALKRLGQHYSAPEGQTDD